MKNIQIVAALVALFISTSALAEDKKSTIAEKKRDFGRKNVLVGADPATMKLMSAIASNVDEKLIQGDPTIELRYPRGGLKLLCLGTGSKYPDMVATTREMNEEEFKRCQKNDIGSIIKLKIGYEALVIVADKKAINLNLDQRKLFLTLANDVPDPKSNGVLIPNIYKKWKDIDSAAPKKAIKIFAPADKTRDARSVSVLGMEGGCRTWDWIAEMKNIQKSYRLYREICHVPRKDGAYIKANSVDTDITKKLLANKNSIGLMGFNNWQKSKSKLKAYAIDELPPTISTISKGVYPLSRSLYVYIKAENLKKVQGLSHLMSELVSEKTLGKKGYLAEMGMVVMPEKELKREMKQASEFTAMTKPEAP